MKNNLFLCIILSTCIIISESEFLEKQNSFGNEHIPSEVYFDSYITFPKISLSSDSTGNQQYVIKM